MAQFDLNSWICPKCGALNSAANEQCAKCDYVVNESEAPKKVKALNDGTIQENKKALNE